MYRSHYFHLHKTSKNPFSMFLRISSLVLMGLAFAIFFSLVFSFIVQWLWNSVLTNVLSVNTITFWQAFGVLILAKILFGGLHHTMGPRHIKRWHYDGDTREVKPPLPEDQQKHYEQYWQQEGQSRV